MAKKRKATKKAEELKATSKTEEQQEKKETTRASAPQDSSEQSLAKVLVDCKSGMTDETTADRPEEDAKPKVEVKTAPAPEASKAKKVDPDTRKVMDDIWKRIDREEISFWCAVVGYDQVSGRAILDEDIIVITLINYGYHIQYIVPFIDEYQEVLSKEGGPIIMMDIKRDQVYSNVDKIPAVVKMMQRLEAKQQRD